MTWLSCYAIIEKPIADSESARWGALDGMFNGCLARWHMYFLWTFSELCGNFSILFGNFYILTVLLCEVWQTDNGFRISGKNWVGWCSKKLTLHMTSRLLLLMPKTCETFLVTLFDKSEPTVLFSLMRRVICRITRLMSASHGWAMGVQSRWEISITANVTLWAQSWLLGKVAVTWPILFYEFPRWYWS